MPMFASRYTKNFLNKRVSIIPKQHCTMSEKTKHKVSKTTSVEFGISKLQI